MNHFELSRLPTYDDKTVIAEMHRIAALLKSKVLSRREFDKHSKVSSSLLVRRFGSWEAALSRAGLADRYSGRTVSAKMRQKPKILSNQEIIGQLRKAADVLKTETLTQEQFNAQSVIHSSSVVRRFGSWEKALEQAGLELSTHARRYSDEEYFENMLTVWTHYGRQPVYGEMKKDPSRITAKAYEQKWGTWKKALLAFIDRVNSDEIEKMPSSPNNEDSEPDRKTFQPPQRGAEKLSLGLRYTVLKRDHFRCVVCGSSPATDLSCQLHVDHFMPSSQGGKTVIENLRTLCSKCNIGKGDKLEDTSST
jgi:hypothetical protein